MTRPLLVLDFDGTVCLGDDPVRIYAQEVTDRIEHPGDLLAQLDSFLDGDLRLPQVEDGYHAVAHLGRGADLSPAELNGAYMASRRRISEGEGRMHPPEGFTHFLGELRSLGVGIVLLTNAPETGATAWLDDHGITPYLDGVVTDAGKPARMHEHLGTLLEQWGLEGSPEALASVGDVWINDVAPALDLGARGFYIDRFDLGVGPSTARAGTFVELYGSITDWARSVIKP